MEIKLASGLNLRLNEKDYTATVIKSEEKREVFIPRFVEHDGIKYTITSIGKGSFEYRTIDSITFSEDSEVISFEEDSFSGTTIKKLQIPPNLKIIKDKWYSRGLDGPIYEIEISPKNKFFKWIDNDFFVGKSNPDSNVFDILLYGRYNIVNAKIPSQIKVIKKYAFFHFTRLKSITFSDDSELECFENLSFNDSQIQKLCIPPKIESLGYNLMIENLVEIQVSPKNKFFKMVENKYLLKKSNVNSKIYDILVLAVRNIEDVKIPKQIKEISDYSFYRCNHINTFSFEPNSSLEKIGLDAFYYSNGIKNIVIPPKVTKLCRGTFSLIDSLETIIFLSEYIELDEHSIYCDNMKLISFPNAKKINAKHDVVIASGSKQLQIEIRQDVEFIDQTFYRKRDHIKYIDEETISKINDLYANEIEINDSDIRNSASDYSETNDSEYENSVENDSEKIKIYNKNSFDFKEIQKLEIPASLEAIESECFSIAFKLKEINVSPKNKRFQYLNNELLVYKSRPNLKEFDTVLFCRNDIEEVSIPSSIRFIKEDSLYNFTTKHVHIQKDSQLEVVEKNGFPCHIEEIFIPKNLKIIGPDVFEKLHDVDKIEVSPKNQTFSLIDNKYLLKKNYITKKFDELVFSRCTDIKFMIPKCVKKIANSAINNQKLEILDFPEDSELETIENNKLYSVKKFTVPQNLKSINCAVFIFDEKLNEIIVSPKNKTYKFVENKFLLKRNVVHNIFSKLVLCIRTVTEAKIPRYVKKIKRWAFRNCKELSSITFESDSSLEIIEPGVFEYCEKLSSIIFPPSLKKIGDLKKCINLKYVKFLSNFIEIDSFPFRYCEKLEVVSFPNAKELKIDFEIPGTTKIEIRKDAKLSGKKLDEYKSRIRYVEPENESESESNSDEEINSLKIEIEDLKKVSSKHDKTIKDLDKKNKMIEEQIEEQDKEIERIQNTKKESSCSSVKQKMTDTNQTSEIKALNSSYVHNLVQLCLIGAGSAGKVYKVEKEEFYAQKNMNVEGEEFNFDRFQRLLQEYELLNMMKHPNIIQVFGFYNGDKKTAPCILMEFCSNNLETLIKQNKLNSFDKVIIIYQIAEGIKYVHFKNIIHRDIKAKNILINDDKTVKICDFGISKYVSGDETSFTGGIGTQKYMAPEILNEEKIYTEKVDVYSFGVLVFFILTGKMPSISIGKMSSGSKAEIPQEVNEFSRSLINDCWEFDPVSRPSFAEICQRIKDSNFELMKLSKSEQIDVLNFVKKYQVRIPKYEESVPKTPLDKLFKTKLTRPKITQPKTSKVKK